MIALITPLHRPWELQRVRDFHARLIRSTRRPCVSLIVSNGAALGMTHLTSDPHQAQAMNVGLDVAQAAGCRYWLKLDSDDHYCDGYAEEQVSALEQTGATLVGKSDCWVRLSDGRLVLRRIRGEDVETTALHGHTLAGVVERELRFRDRGRPCGEDTDLIERVAAAGGMTYATSRHGCCHIRNQDGLHHTFDRNDAAYLGVAIAAGTEVFDTGEQLSDDVVSGRREPKRLALVPMPDPRDWEVWSARAA